MYIPLHSFVDFFFAMIIEHFPWFWSHCGLIEILSKMLAKWQSSNSINKYQFPLFHYSYCNKIKHLELQAAWPAVSQTWDTWLKLRPDHLLILPCCIIGGKIRSQELGFYTCSATARPFRVAGFYSESRNGTLRINRIIKWMNFIQRWNFG